MIMEDTENGEHGTNSDKNEITAIHHSNIRSIHSSVPEMQTFPSL
jgi:hypothetical protein